MEKMSYGKNSFRGKRQSETNGTIGFYCFAYAKQHTGKNPRTRKRDPNSFVKITVTWA